MNIFQTVIYKLVCRYLAADRKRAVDIINDTFFGDERFVEKLLPKGTHIHSNPVKKVKE